MKCPKCGRQIPDGSLFCKYCFAEIRIVPTYESKVEEKISDVMQGITDDVKEQAKSEQETRRLDEKRRKRIRIGFLTFCAGIAALAALIGGTAFYSSHTLTYAQEQAAQAAQAGNYEEAARILQEALTSSSESHPDLLLLRASYLEKAGRYEEAVSLCKLVLASSSSSKEQIQEAYGTIIQVYQDTQEYAKINDMLSSCGDESVQEMYSEYMVSVPKASSPSGNYAESLTLELSVPGDSSIFYTTDRTTPTTKDTLYTGPLHLGPGSWTVTAISVNHYGLSSDPARYFYTVTSGEEAGEGATEQAQE